MKGMTSREEARDTKGITADTGELQHLPPGDNIGKQKTADIRDLEFKQQGVTGIPGDGGFPA